MSIFITGDTHAGFRRFRKKTFPQQAGLTKDDYVIICGDFGGVWDGGKVQRIRPSVIHLMRGQVYELEGLRIFTFGGAKSHDISGGILEASDPNLKSKRKKLDKKKELYRINHLSWWKEELPSEEEMAEGLRNLINHNWSVDYIFSHCCATSTQERISGGVYQPDILTRYFEKIKEMCRYRKWFFGHYHDNVNVNSREILLYEQIIRIH